MRLRTPAPLLAIALACSPEAPMEDPTPPGVSARIPEPASGNVWVRDPIRATFSEPLDSLTVTPANVSVTRNGGNELGKTLQLSDDGRVLGIVLVSPPTVPATLTVTLAPAIADRAGNPLTPGAPWSWTLPAWQQPGGAPLSAPSGWPWQVVAVEPGGAILVASSEPVEVNGAAVGTVRVKRWTGAAWEPLGGRSTWSPPRTPSCRRSRSRRTGRRSWPGWRRPAERSSPRCS